MAFKTRVTDILGCKYPIIAGKRNQQRLTFSRRYDWSWRRGDDGKRARYPGADPITEVGLVVFISISMNGDEGLRVVIYRDVELFLDILLSLISFHDPIISIVYYQCCCGRSWSNLVVD